MAEQVSTWVGQTFPLTTQYSWTVTDMNGSGRTVNFGTVSTTTYWSIGYGNQSASPSTNPKAPSELLYYMSSQLGVNGSSQPLWVFIAQSAGTIGIGYNGTGTASITDSDSTLSRILGLVPHSGTNLTITGATNGSVNAGVLGSGAQSLSGPMYVLLASGRANSTNWQYVPPKMSGGVMPDGSTYGDEDNIAGRVQSFDFQNHPYSPTTQAADGSPISPVWPSPSRLTAPTILPSNTMVPPWSLADFVGSCLYLGSGTQLKAALGTFTPGTFAGAVAASGVGIGGTYLSAYLTIDSAMKMKRSGPTAANYPRRVNWSGVELRDYPSGDSNSLYSQL